MQSVAIIELVLTSVFKADNRKISMEIPKYDNLRLHIVCLENCTLSYYIKGMPCTYQYGACSMVSVYNLQHLKQWNWTIGVDVTESPDHCWAGKEIDPCQIIEVKIHLIEDWRILPVVLLGGRKIDTYFSCMLYY